ncbi:TPA: VOC family protein [Mannheimia haemolytica]|uniref:Virulence protein STM3117 n=1 Tax=Mannheimia haemolytica TaxID=75985 RepID=A0A378NE81_MANHA|nr:VOC family protein [Mannheimia haemolytica]AGQ38555.1 glyoxalase [Mannheimia haemolytica D171]AJE07239.1 VOC family virulence protein [Mannheimia haemolytica USDA-ARS-USMARC-184]EEY10753.1 putative dioxygenase [Mannheimia haemolytica serotype A2 str. OVINE]EEY12656.1 putative dioxygenase [Mannheimia haemolytica serotype A2 str. BOVINE]KYL11102.1 glyoxalase [Mannheimia haemolytica]
MIKITALDHLVLTVADMQKTIDFYTTILGMQEIAFGDNRKALLFGTQKINLHQKGAEILPNAQNADCGTADLCLLTVTPLQEVIYVLQRHQVEILEGGIVPRTGAVGKIESVYCRDPDGNLIEISRYV